MNEPEDDPHAAFAAMKARAETLEQQVRDMEAIGARRLREAELKTEATRAGIIDIDGLRLIDPVALDGGPGGSFDAGSIVAQLRRDKPWLFGAGNSSSLQAVPTTTPSRTRLATDMSVEEWRAARAALLRRR